MKKLHFIICMLLVSLLLLTACATGQGGSDSTTVNMTVFAGGETIIALWDEYIGMVEESLPHIDLNLEKAVATSPEEYIMSRVAGGDFPDLMWVFQPALLIDGEVIQEMPKELYDMLINPGDFLVGGKLYTMPMHIGVLGMWYNMDIFAEAGITTLPETWSEFITALEKIAAIGIDPLGMAAMEGWYIAGFFNFLWAPATYGPEPNWPHLRSQGQVLFNNPVTRRSLEQLRETQQFWQGGAMSASYGEVQGLFTRGEVAIFMNGGSYNVPEVESGEWVFDFPVGYLMPPQDNAAMRRANSFQDNLWVINKEVTGDTLDASVDLLKFFYSDEFYPKHLAANNNVTSIKGFEDFVTPLSNPVAIAMAESMSAAIQQCGTVPHAHAAQGDNMWPAGLREMSEIVVQELAAGNDDLDALMDMFDAQWDIGLQQAG